MAHTLKSVEELLRRHGSGHMLSALAILPKKISFESQDPHEEIILLLRPHWATNVWWMAVAILLVFVPLFWPFFSIITLFPQRYIFILTMLWYALVISFVFEQFLTWFFSVNIVTDERIIDVDFYGLLFKQVAVSQIGKIQDLNYVQKGVIPAMLNYGSILIQTAGQIPTFDFTNVPNPDQIVKIISELIQQEEQEAIEQRVR